MNERMKTDNGPGYGSAQAALGRERQARQEAEQRLKEFSDYMYQRLKEWLANPNRQPSHLAFTAGPERNAATAIEESGVLEAEQRAERAEADVAALRELAVKWRDVHWLNHQEPVDQFETVSDEEIQKLDDESQSLIGDPANPVDHPGQSLLAERDRLRADIQKVIDVAHKHGWNGVENSKRLWTFFDEAMQHWISENAKRCDEAYELEAERDRLRRELQEVSERRDEMTQMLEDMKRDRDAAIREREGGGE